MRYFLQGLTLVVKDSSLWRYIYIPVLVTLALFSLLFWVGYLTLPPLIAVLLERIGADQERAQTFAYILFWLFGILVSGLLFGAISGFLSSLLWDRLSLRVEQRVYGEAPTQSLPLPVVVSDSVQRGLLSIVLGSAALCCSWALFGIPSMLIAGYMGLLDFTAPALARRRIALRGQRTLVAKLHDHRSFIVAGALVSMVPLLNVLLAPALVAGGTIMVVESERQGRLASSLSSPS